MECSHAVPTVAVGWKRCLNQVASDRNFVPYRGDGATTVLISDEAEGLVNWRRSSIEHPEDQAWQQPGLGSQLLSERDELLVQGAAVEKAAVLVDMVSVKVSFLCSMKGSGESHFFIYKPSSMSNHQLQKLAGKSICLTRTEPTSLSISREARIAAMKVFRGGQKFISTE